MMTVTVLPMKLKTWESRARSHRRLTILKTLRSANSAHNFKKNSKKTIAEMKEPEILWESSNS
jgi:hypothetical protein